MTWANTTFDYKFYGISWTTPKRVHLTPAEAPSVSRIEPSVNEPAGGVNIRVIGTNFENTPYLACKFGGKKVRFMT